MDWRGVGGELGKGWGGACEGLEKGGEAWLSKL